MVLRRYVLTRQSALKNCSEVALVAGDKNEVEALCKLEIRDLCALAKE